MPEILEALHTKAKNGDWQAAKVYLDYVRHVITDHELTESLKAHDERDGRAAGTPTRPCATCWRLPRRTAPKTVETLPEEGLREAEEGRRDDLN